MDLRVYFLGFALAAPAAAFAGPSSVAVHVESAARVTHDSNVFLQDGGPLIAGATTSAPIHESAWMASAAVGVSASGDAAAAGKFELGYRAEVFRFDGLATENHDDHRVRASLVGTSGRVSWDAAANVLWTNGARLAPVYNLVGGAPALGNEPVRARRAQTVLKGAARLTVTQPAGWWRVLAAGLDQDFHTGFASGCASYVDRGECTLGAEFARHLGAGIAVVGGARVGRQTQADRPPTANLHSTSGVLRVVAGLEGKVGAWKIDVRAGPDFRRFNEAQPAELSRHRTAPYAEATIAWMPDATDTFSLSGCHRLWPASSGRGVYEDSTWELGWKRRLNGAWSTRLGQKFADGDNHRDAYPGTKPWHDQILTTTGALEYRWSAHVVLDASITREAAEGLLPNTPGRAYTRVLCSLGVAGTW